MKPGNGWNHPVQWVTLHNIYTSTFREMWILDYSCMSNQWTIHLPERKAILAKSFTTYACMVIEFRLKNLHLECISTLHNPHYSTGDSAIRADCTDEWWEARQWATPHRDRQEGVQVPTESSNSLLPGCYRSGSSWVQVYMHLYSTVIMSCIY